MKTFPCRKTLYNEALTHSIKDFKKHKNIMSAMYVLKSNRIRALIKNLLSAIAFITTDCSYRTFIDTFLTN